MFDAASHTCEYSHTLPYVQANLDKGFGVVDSGGFIKCDLAADGRTMAGCTGKGHLIQWDINLELRKGPNGQVTGMCEGVNV